MPAFSSFRSVVDPAQCDFLGHMNVSRYFAACSDAVIALQSRLGLTAEDVRAGRRLSFAVVHAESDFLAELRPGDAIWMESDILEIGGKSMTFRHRLFSEPDRTPCFETRFKCVLMNLETRRAAEVPGEVRDRATAFLADEG